MAKRQDKKAKRVREMFDAINATNRQNWQKVNQKGYDFYLDNQLTNTEKTTLEDQGMPTFTINRIIPVVEMLNFYATASNPRWQAVGVEGSDSDVAAVFADISDYIWNLSSGSTLFGNAVNDAITKSIGYLMVTVDSNQDRGMGEVIIQQPDPFDVYVDPKSRDPLFRDASHIIVRKVMTKTQLINLKPEHEAKIKRSSSTYTTDFDYSEATLNDNDFQFQDVTESFGKKGVPDEMVEYFETYEREKRPFYNVFYQVLPPPEEMQKIQEEVQIKLEEMQKEMEVAFEELQVKLQRAVEAQEMIPERMQLELEKQAKLDQEQLQAAEQQLMAEAQKKATIIQNKVISEKEYKIIMEEEEFAKNVTEAVKFYKDGIKLCCVSGDVTLYESHLPISQYPIIPITYKWTGTPFPLSAVSPLVGKQKELNKAHQLMVHNASLGSSLRWMYYEGSIDTDYWEKNATAPGALLPVNSGYDNPTEVMPAQLSNALYSIVQEGKGDMEYLAGIYSSMQGDTGSQHETYRGMLALDEYGTRRVKQWLKGSIDPALKQIGEVVKEYSQAVYQANKVFRIVQPSAVQEERTVEINVPIYNDLGQAIGKWRDYASAKFDVRIVSGSTLPLNRWAYLAELKELMKLGVVDDVAVLAETDIRNKEKIMQRKSLYAQLTEQLNQLQESLKDKDGTIETLERQLVQAGIQDKVRNAEAEIRKGVTQTQGRMALAASKMEQDSKYAQKQASLEVSAIKKSMNGKK